MQSAKLLAYEETDVMVSTRDSFFDAEFEFSDNLAYAFGVTAYDDNREPVEDPTIGVLRPYYKSWGLKGVQAKGVSFDPLPTRECKNAELHINN